MLLLLMEAKNTVGVFLAFEYVSFTTHFIDMPGSRPAPSCIVTGDFNNDHLPDIAIGNAGVDTVGIYLNYGNGTFSEQITTSIESYPLVNFLAVGDFNNDHHLDIAVTNSMTDTIGILLGHGNGYFTQQHNYSTGSGSQSCAISMGYFNNLDVAVVNTDSSSIAIFPGDKDGSLTHLMSDSTGISSTLVGIAAMDLNRDDHSDLVVANRGKQRSIDLPW